MADLRIFTKRIKALAGRIGVNVNKTVIQTAVAVQQTVVLATPVDTGRARGNWQLNVGSRITDEIERLDQGGSATIAENATKAVTRREGQNIFISNNVNYIGFLNEGSSAQAPAGFVEMAVQAAVGVIRNAKVVK